MKLKTVLIVGAIVAAITIASLVSFFDVFMRK